MTGSLGGNFIKGARGSFLAPPAVEGLSIEELVRDDSTAYGVFLVFLFCLPFFIALIIRTTTDPTYLHECVGCQFETTDTIIVLILAIIMVIPYLIIMWRTWRAPDPLGIVIEARMTFYMGVIFALPIFILYMADPGNIQVHLYFSWLTVEATGVMAIMLIQTYAQILLARWASQVPSQINLLRSLENVPFFFRLLVARPFSFYVMIALTLPPLCMCYSRFTFVLYSKSI